MNAKRLIQVILNEEEAHRIILAIAVLKEGDKLASDDLEILEDLKDELDAVT